MTLTHIPGIGEKMSDKILAQVDMQTIFKQLQQCNFREVSSIDVDGKVLGRIIRYYMSSKYGFDYQSCVQSPGITKIFNSILASVRKHIVLKRNQLQLAAWHPTCDVSEIRRRQQYIEGCKQFAGRYDAEQKKQMRSLLRVANIEKVAQEHVLVLCDEDDVYERLRKECPSWVQVVQLLSIQEFEGYMNEDFVRYAYTSDSKFAARIGDADHIETIQFTCAEDIVPEMVLHRFRSERIFIESVVELVDVYDVHVSTINVEVLRGILDRLNENLGGTTIMDRDDLQRFCDSVEKLVEERLSNMQVSGGELLRMLRSEVGQNPLLQKIIADIKRDLGVDQANREKLSFLDFTGALPVIDEDRLRDAEREHAINKERRMFEFAKHFKNEFEREECLLDICKDILDNIDLLLGFGDAFDGCTAPMLSERITLRSVVSRSLHDAGTTVQPITYNLDSQCTLLTGANSGGKTSMLNLLAETVLLTMMGMQVMGQSSVPLYEELHYFKKSNGTVGSGAFETTLHSLSSIVQSTAKSLVLIDEIESITEPGAAATLISSTLDYMHDNGTQDVVLVTHLGATLTDSCPYARVDGIEASHLDDDLNLVVDRNPKMNYLARSTPQLIVEKLSKRNVDDAYFRYLFERLQ